MDRKNGVALEAEEAVAALAGQVLLKFYQHEVHPIADFPPKPSMILASRKTYQKLSSNGIDLADLSTIAKF
jgi:hypothetical protein